MSERIENWVKDLPSCLESTDPQKRERHLQWLKAQGGWCPRCGRCAESYTVSIKAGDRLDCWVNNAGVVIALIHNSRLIVFPIVG